MFMKIEKGIKGFDIFKGEVIVNFYGYGFDYFYCGDLLDVLLDLCFDMVKKL